MHGLKSACNQTKSLLKRYLSSSEYVSLLFIAIGIRWKCPVSRRDCQHVTDLWCACTTKYTCNYFANELCSKLRNHQRQQVTSYVFECFLALLTSFVHFDVFYHLNTRHRSWCFALFLHPTCLSHDSDFENFFLSHTGNQKPQDCVIIFCRLTHIALHGKEIHLALGMFLPFVLTCTHQAIRQFTTRASTFAEVICAK